MMAKRDKTTRLLGSLKSRPEKKTPIATDMFVPNHSGTSSHPETKRELVPYTGANKEVDLGSQDIKTTGEATADVIQKTPAATPGEEVLDIAPDATGDGSGITGAGYVNGHGVKYFKNCSAKDHNPCLTFYGWGDIVGPQQYNCSIGIDRYGRLVFGGSARFTFFTTNIKLEKGLYFGGANNGFIVQNKATSPGYTCFGASKDAASTPVWVMTTETREASNFNPGVVDGPQLWLHDGSSTLTNLLKIYHYTNSIINSAAGLLKLQTGGTDALTIDTSQKVGIGTTAPACKLDVTGAIRGGTTTISSDSDAFDVVAVNSVKANTGSATITLGGLANGVNGQVVHIVKTTSANNLVIEHNEGAGTQKIITADGADITLTNYGGVTLVCDGTNWFVVSQ